MQMLEFAPYYYFVYWFVVMILTIQKISEMQSSRGYGLLYQQDNYNSIVFFSVFYILLFGLRPISMVFWDTVTYDGIYQMMKTYGTTEEMPSIDMSSDKLFYTFMW